MSSLFSIYHKVCPACASMRPREETRCICGHSFTGAPVDPELTEEQLYEDYLRARMQQIQEVLRISGDHADTAGTPLTRPEQMRAQTELRAVQAELDRQRARIERMRRSGKAWAGGPIATGQGGRSEGPRVAQAAEALEQELARLRRGQQNEIVRVRPRVPTRASHARPPEAQTPVVPPPEAQTPVVPPPGTRASADSKGAGTGPESLAQDVVSIPPVAAPEPPLVIPPAEYEHGTPEHDPLPLPNLQSVPAAAIEHAQRTDAPDDIGATPLGDVRTLLTEQGERTRSRQQAEALIECPNCTAHFPKEQPRCKCGFEQPAVSALMPAITLDLGERQQFGPLLKRD
ncbi:MAG: hypothetical protein ACYCRH_07085 [Acidiferrobacteraceae bacterium]